MLPAAPPSAARGAASPPTHSLSAAAAKGSTSSSFLAPASQGARTGRSYSGGDPPVRTGLAGQPPSEQKRTAVQSAMLGPRTRRAIRAPLRHREGVGRPGRGHRGVLRDGVPHRDRPHPGQRSRCTPIPAPRSPSSGALRCPRPRRLRSPTRLPGQCNPLGAGRDSPRDRAGQQPSASAPASISTQLCPIDRIDDKVPAPGKSRDPFPSVRRQSEEDRPALTESHVEHRLHRRSHQPRVLLNSSLVRIVGKPQRFAEI